MSKRSRCAECDALVDGGEYHPYLYCELYKLGHKEPGHYLKRCGFVREEEVATQRACADAAEKERDGVLRRLSAFANALDRR